MSPQNNAAREVSPPRSGTLLICLTGYPDHGCGARWRRIPRTPALTLPKCPGCGCLSGKRANNRRRADLTLDDLRAALEGGGFTQVSDDAAAEEGETWECSAKYNADYGERRLAVTFRGFVVAESEPSGVMWVRISQFRSDGSERLDGRKWAVDRHSFAFHLKRALMWMAR